MAGMAESDSWLYRQGDLILGPVSAAQVVEKIYSGEISPKAEVQAMGSGTFLPVSAVPAFKVHVAKAEAKTRVDAHAAAHSALQKKKTTRTLTVAMVSLAVVGVALAVAGRYLAVHANFFDDTIEQTEISIDIVAARRSVDDELIEYSGPNAGKPRPAPTPGGSGSPSRPPTAAAAPTTPKAPRMGKADDEGMQMGEVDQASINAVVAQHKPSLVPCIRQIAKPGVAARIPIEFTITEAGKVSKVWVDNPDFRTGVLPECLLKELQKWPFKASPAGGASVQLNFKIGNPS
jgi:hypothetical protein